MPKFIQIVDGVFHEVEKDIQTVIDELESVAATEVKAAETFLSTAAKLIAANGGPLLIQAAQAAVAAAVGSANPFAAAGEIALKTLETLGKPIAQNALNTAIEAAVSVQNYSNAQAAAIPPVSGSGGA